MKKIWDKYIRQPIKQWWHRLVGKLAPPPAPPAPPEAPAAPGTPATDPAAQPDRTGDEVDFRMLAWTCGGFGGGGAVLGVPRIGALKVSSSGLTLRWLTGLESWGLARTDAGAIAALFCLVDGHWRGGKFDWISTSRASRDFNNIRSGYQGWRPADLDTADAYAFVVVSADGRRRSNVITCART